jgi:hypothetical protein
VIATSGRRSFLAGNPGGDFPLLERDDFSSNRHPALIYSLSMVFSENGASLDRRSPVQQVLN